MNIRASIVGTACFGLAVIPTQAFAGWAAITLKVAELAAPLVAKTLLSDAPGVTNEELLTAIRQSTAEIKAFIAEDVRTAFTEFEQKRLEGQSQSIARQIGDYNSASQMKPVRPILDALNAQTSDAIGDADKFSPAAMGAYANLVSMRMFVKQQLFLLDQDTPRHLNFAKELRGFSVTLRQHVATVHDSLIPDNRLSKITCSLSTSGGQFPITEAVCSFKLDGKLLPENEARSTIQNNDFSAVSNNAFRLRDQRTRELFDFLKKAEIEMLGPLRQTALVWDLTALKIDPTLGPPQYVREASILPPIPEPKALPLNSELTRVR